MTDGQALAHLSVVRLGGRFTPAEKEIRAEEYKSSRGLSQA